MTHTTVVGRTPGPWSADVHVPRGSADAEWRIHGGRELVAIVNDDEYTEANARLIAAAPEMLEALKQALVVMESVAETHGYDTEVGAVPAARAAIAKATGQ